MLSWLIFTAIALQVLIIIICKYPVCWLGTHKWDYPGGHCSKCGKCDEFLGPHSALFCNEGYAIPYDKLTPIALEELHKDDFKDEVCTYCGKTGHWSPDCDKKYADILYETKPAIVADAILRNRFSETEQFFLRGNTRNSIPEPFRSQLMRTQEEIK